jgi:hypothetical protein
MGQWKRFGTEVFRLYETHPLIMNTIGGGILYAAGETATQVRLKANGKFSVSNWEQVFHVGILGAAENGFMMSAWYNFTQSPIDYKVGTRS